MNRGQIVDRCEARFKDTTNRVITTAEWAAYVNDAYREVQAADPTWPWMQQIEAAGNLTLSAGDNEADLSAALSPVPYRLVSVYNATDEIHMTPLPEGAGHQHDLFPPSAPRGAPELYRYVDNSLYVYPTPSRTTTFHLDYLGPQSDLGNDSDTPAFPAQFHDALVHGALAAAYEDDDDYARSDRHRMRFQQILTAMRTALLYPRTEGYPGIIDTFGS